jgi:hypothetical protein
MVNAEVLKDFNRYPDIVAKAAELLAKGDSVCVLLGNHCAVATTWDSDISAIARKVELDPKYEDGINHLGYLGWDAGSTVDQPVVAGTITAKATRQDPAIRVQAKIEHDPHHHRLAYRLNCGRDVLVEEIRITPSTLGYLAGSKDAIRADLIRRLPDRVMDQFPGHGGFLIKPRCGRRIAPLLGHGCAGLPACVRFQQRLFQLSFWLVGRRH